MIMLIRTVSAAIFIIMFGISCTSAWAATETLTWQVSTASITSITPRCSASGSGTVTSPCTLSDTAAGGTSIAAIDVGLSTGTFSGTLQLVASGGSCTSGDTTHFQIASNVILASATSTPPTTDGNYTVCIQATQSSASNSPQYAQVIVLVSPQQVQSSPQIVAVTATPNAFLTSSGTVNAQLTTTCLGNCPSAPSYTLMSNPTGMCSGNNNNSFSLTPGGNLTGSGFSSTMFACVAVKMTGASNSGQIFLLHMTSVPSPSINLITLRQSYFSSGSTFSSLIDIACQSPTVLGTTNDPSLCTGIPTYTLDNTSGDCTIANNTGPGGTTPTFAISGNTLSLTAPQTVAGDYYACVTTAMTGATSTHTQLKATLGANESTAANISGTYFDPPFYATNSAYSGTIVAYCISPTLNTTAGFMAVHCPSTPSYTFSSSCGSNNNNDFTLSGPNNSVITSNGSLTTGNLFPCIVTTITGAGGSGTANYVNLYASTGAALQGISIYPTWFSTSKGSMTAALRPICTGGISGCTGTPVYAIDNTTGHCTGTINNSLFGLTGSALTITTSTPGTYTACLDLSMTGATNSGSPFSVTVTATSAIGNCPATPPPQAAAVGFTTLLKCLDASQPFYANVFNWVNCAPGVIPSTMNQFWQVGGTPIGLDCGVSEGAPLVTQVIDPVTGDTVLDFHWDGKTNTDLTYSSFATLTETPPNAPDYPQAIYAEYNIRLSPDHRPEFSAQCCAPDFWTFATMSNVFASQNPPLPSGCVQLDPTNFCYNEIPEVDILESGNGSGFLDAVHQYGVPGDPNTGHLTCCLSGQGFLSSGDTPSQEMWNANMFPHVPFQDYHSYGARFLTDGVASTQYCYYWDNYRVQSFTGSGTPRFADSCQVVNFTGQTNSLNYQLRGRHQFNLWFSGGWAFNSYTCQNASSICTGNGQQGSESQDTYLRYIAIWGPANANQYNTGTGFDSQPPAPVAQPWPY